MHQRAAAAARAWPCLARARATARVRVRFRVWVRVMANPNRNRNPKPKPNLPLGLAHRDLDRVLLDDQLALARHDLLVQVVLEQPVVLAVEVEDLQVEP